MERIAVLIASSPTSPSAGRAFQLIRDLSAEGHSVTLCLLEDGVYAAGARASAYPLDRCAAVLVLEGDLDLRGVRRDALHESCRPCSYAGMVDVMMEQADRTLGAF
ncbi:MAG TPA: DsrH/TusB family sulfur metabolism protein [Symbiobacteriaceae bacterium]|nr:DsrH/TusB family sulfur metabolism protein [Symbiobacteriaceae bacterium]